MKFHERALIYIKRLGVSRYDFYDDCGFSKEVGAYFSRGEIPILESQILAKYRVPAVIEDITPSETLYLMRNRLQMSQKELNEMLGVWSVWHFENNSNLDSVPESQIKLLERFITLDPVFMAGEDEPYMVLTLPYRVRGDDLLMWHPSESDWIYIREVSDADPS